MSRSVFADVAGKVWKHRYQATLEVDRLVGGTPSDPKVAAGWLKTRLGGDVGKDRHLLEMVHETMIERGVDEMTAIEEVAGNVNGFKRDDGAIVLEGRCPKAMIKEAFSVALAGGHLSGRGWGATNKGLLGYVAEHVMIPDRYIPIVGADGPMSEPTGVQQRFVSTFRGQGIAYEEFAEDCTLSFQVWSDHDFDEQWPVVWTLAEQQGIGSTRSQGFGKFVLVQWDEVEVKPKRARRSA